MCVGSKRPPCAGSKRLRVYQQNARMCSTCERFAGTHAGVLNLHTEGFPACQAAHTTHTHTHTTPHNKHNIHHAHTPLTLKHKMRIPQTLSAHTPHRTYQHTHTPTHTTHQTLPSTIHTPHCTHTTITTTHTSHAQNTHHTHHTHHTRRNAWTRALRSTDHDLALDKNLQYL